jgi:branched-chain amino acid transport system ATP-binding protein/urea transport system ATP-binding protein
MLEIADLHAGYGATPALFGVDLRVEAAQITALMGRNGMGKSTLLRAVMGQLDIAAGSIVFAGRQIAGRASHEIARAGIGYVPQGRELFADLTVEENLLLGALGHPGQPIAIPARLVELFPIVDERRYQRAGSLSGGEQQQLAIARALMGRPKLLLLDEPSEGVQPSIVEAIAAALARIAAEDRVGILLVEQSLELALGTAELVHFMEEGRIVADATPAELHVDRRPLERYLGL